MWIGVDCIYSEVGWLYISRLSRVYGGVRKMICRD